MAERYQRLPQQYGPPEDDPSTNATAPFAQAPMPWDPLTRAARYMQGPMANAQPTVGGPVQDINLNPVEQGLAQIPKNWKEAAMMAAMAAAPVVGQAAWKARGVPTQVMRQLRNRPTDPLMSKITAKGEIEANPKSYDAWQHLVDAEEDRVRASGGDPLKMYADRNEKSIFGQPMHEVLTPEAGWSEQPKAVTRAYKGRDAIGEAEKSETLAGITERLKSVNVSNSDALANDIFEITRPNVMSSRPNDIVHDVGMTANTALKQAMREAGETSDKDYFGLIKAITGGTPENSGIQLVFERSRASIPSQRTFQRAQQILDAVMGGKAPKMPNVYGSAPTRPVYKRLGEPK